MDTLSNASGTKYELPLSEADQTALRPALLRDLGALRSRDTVLYLSQVALRGIATEETVTIGAQPKAVHVPYTLEQDLQGVA